MQHVAECCLLLLLRKVCCSLLYNLWLAECNVFTVHCVGSEAL